ncbi:MAG: hypothetical protein KDK39_11915 [Leptospiraceae bacterium]|nr:hypothetical protein [Leptospiraceae bacterium]
MSDILFSIAICIGFLLQVVLLARENLDRKRAWRVIGGSAVWLLGSVLIELVFWLAARIGLRAGPYYPGEVVIGAIFMYLYVFPFYGFFENRLLQVVNRSSVWLLTVVFWYSVLVLPTSPARYYPILFYTTIAVNLIAFTLSWSRQPGSWARLFIYGWFLYTLMLLALMELPRAFVFLNDNSSDWLNLARVVLAAMLLLYFTFHIWFALKYLLVLMTCLRSSGRQLAFRMIAQKVTATEMPIMLSLLVLALQVGLYALNYYQHWMDPMLMIQISVIVLPQALGWWLYWHRKGASVPNGTVPGI